MAATRHENGNYKTTGSPGDFPELPEALLWILFKEDDPGNVLEIKPASELQHAWGCR